MPTKNDIKDYVRDVIQKHDSRLATTTSAGLMSAADKIKLDNIQFDFGLASAHSSLLRVTYEKPAPMRPL